MIHAILLFFALTASANDSVLAVFSGPKVERAAAIALVSNPPAAIQAGTIAYIQPLLSNYEASEIYSGENFAPWLMKTTTPEKNPILANYMQFLSKAIELIKKHDVIDVFVLSHGNDYYEFLANLAPELRKKIRLVYNAGCEDSKDAQKWLALGAKTYVAHPGPISCSPYFFAEFKDSWAAGKTAWESTNDGNRLIDSVVRDWDPICTFAETQGIVFGNTGTRISSHLENSRNSDLSDEKLKQLNQIVIERFKHRSSAPEAAAVF